jgi:hypothetical protein
LSGRARPEASSASPLVARGPARRLKRSLGSPAAAASSRFQAGRAHQATLLHPLASPGAKPRRPQSLPEPPFARQRAAAAGTGRRRRARLPAPPPPRPSAQTGPSHSLDPSPSSPGRERRRAHRIPTTRAGRLSLGTTLQSQGSFRGPSCKRLTAIVK